MQRGVLDFMALSLGLACSLRPASHRLTMQRPHQWLCMPRNFVIFTILILVSAGMYGVWCMGCSCGTCQSSRGSRVAMGVVARYSYVVCMTSPAAEVVLCYMQSVYAFTELLLLTMFSTYGKSSCAYVCACPCVCVCVCTCKCVLCELYVPKSALSQHCCGS